MLVRFTKGSVTAKTDTLTCARHDGTSTHCPMPKQGILPHAAFHFVVEITLDWRDAFFGAIAEGATVEEATARSHTAKKSPPPRFRQIEALIACLQAEQWGGTSEHAAFAEKLATACRRSRVAPPTLTPADLTRVRLALREFGAAWRPLSPGQSLERSFP
jgi:hypothetical protein